MEVSDDEAEELRKRGINVKTAADTVLDTALQGTVGTLGAFGGYKLLGNWLDQKRKARADAALQKSRRRVQGLIEGDPQSGDEGLARAMKVASLVYLKHVGDLEVRDVLMAKEAASAFPSVGGSLAGAVGEAAAPIGIPLGIAGTLVAMNAFNKGNEENKYKARSKALRDYLNNLGPEAPMAVMTPIQRKAAIESPSELHEHLQGLLGPLSEAAEKDLADVATKYEGIHKEVVGHHGAGDHPKVIETITKHFGEPSGKEIAVAIQKHGDIRHPEVEGTILSTIHGGLERDLMGHPEFSKVLKIKKEAQEVVCPTSEIVEIPGRPGKASMLERMLTPGAGIPPQYPCNTPVVPPKVVPRQKPAPIVRPTANV